MCRAWRPESPPTHPEVINDEFAEGGLHRLSIIGSLREGFETLNRKLWLLLFPVLLDLWLWLGPEISGKPVLHRLVTAFLKSARQLQPGDWYKGTEKLLASMEGVNLSMLLANELVGLPSFVATATKLPMPDSWHRTVFAVHTPLGLVVVLFGLFVIGLFISALFYKIAVVALLQGNDQLPSPGKFAKGVVNAWLQSFLFTIILFVGIMTLAVPMSFGVAFITLISPSLGMGSMGFFLMLLSWAIVIVLFFLAFSIEAVVWDDINILDGMRMSITVVNRYFWATLGFLVLSNVLVLGFSVIWKRLTFSPAGVTVSIIGNAYIGVGVALAGLIFYKSRYTMIFEEKLAESMEKALGDGGKSLDE